MKSSVDVHNIFANIPAMLDTEIFEDLAKGGGVTIERIISKGHRSPETGWYDQEKNEWVMVLKGEAILLYEDGESINLNPGDYINIPAHTKHRVQWTAPGVETIWLAVHY
ncbi:MAG: cupin domain-containing protein [Gammaproteobacteria bacterium]|nr:cupin domain-containing protein [Gammaproteobacteria bacterium]